MTPLYSIENSKDILQNFSILIDGKYRENNLDSGVFKYIEKYRSTKCNSDTETYHYNFCIETYNYLQPSGAMNLSRFKNIEFEFNTLIPSIDPSGETIVVCDEEGGVIGTVDKELYLYTYTMYLFEERYNILRFTSGNAGLLYAR